MEGFKVDTNKLDIYAEGLTDHGTRIREMQGDISSIRTNMRHKLRAMENIDKTLRKIEERLEQERGLMTGLGSVLGQIADDYRNSERRIVDLGVSAVSSGQVEQWQQVGDGFESSLRLFGTAPMDINRIPEETLRDIMGTKPDLQSISKELFESTAIGKATKTVKEKIEDLKDGLKKDISDFRDNLTDPFRRIPGMDDGRRETFRPILAVGGLPGGDYMDGAKEYGDMFWEGTIDGVLNDMHLGWIPQKAKDVINFFTDPFGWIEAVDDMRQDGATPENVGGFISGGMLSGGGS